uniref:Uncharacterized protein n=1 Tax=Anguilla anguilla TaxID=7936 RepID=A0A0E9VNP5_ANGAN
MQIIKYTSQSLEENSIMQIAPEEQMCNMMNR